MDTDTVNPQAPAPGTEPADSYPRTGSEREGSYPRTGSEREGSYPRTGSEPAGSGPERAALRRPFQDRMLAGVAAGLARHFGVDVMLVRIAFVVLTIIGGGAGLALYLAGLLLIPDEGSDVSVAASLLDSLRSR